MLSNYYKNIKDFKNGQFFKHRYIETRTVPSDQHEPKAVTEQRRISINKLMEEISTIVLAKYDAEMGCRARAAKGSVKKGFK